MFNSISQNSDNLQALERAENVNAVLESITQVITNLKRLANQPSLIPEDSQIILHNVGILESFLQALDINSDLYEVVAEHKSLRELFPSKIAQLGLANDIIKLDLQGLTIQEIADRFSISYNAVSNFLKIYKQAKPTEKARVTRPTLRDTEWQLENLATVVYQMISQLDTSTQGDTKVAAIKEARALAESFDKMINQREQLKIIESKYTSHLQSIVVLYEECITLIEDPLIKQKVVNHFQRGLGILGPAKVDQRALNLARK